MSKEHIQELSRLIGELNAHAYATNEHYHNCYEKICFLIDVMKQQPSEVDQLIENIRAIRVELAKVKNGNYLFSSTDYERIDKMLYDLQYKTDTPK